MKKIVGYIEIQKDKLEKRAREHILFICSTIYLPCFSLLHVYTDRMKKNKETKFVDTWENYKKLKDNLISNRCTGIIYFHKSNDYIWEHIKKIEELHPEYKNRYLKTIILLKEGK